MESLPLGRTEWIRFYGLLFGKEAMADSIFRETEDRYLELKELAKTVTNRPAVISEKKFGSSWYMPAGDSYIAHLYTDAGADYIFKDLPGAGSTPLSFETVLDKAIHADIWLIKYNHTKTCVPSILPTRTLMPLRIVGSIPVIQVLFLTMRSSRSIRTIC